MRLILMLVTVVLFASLMLALAPVVLEQVLEIIVSFLLLVCYALIVAISFSIASLVFFALCLRIAGDGAPLDNSHSAQHQFWMWTGT